MGMTVTRLKAVAMARSGRDDWDAMVEASRAVFIWKLTRVLRHRQERTQ